MRSRPAVLVLVWLVGAVVATSVGLLAVQLVASQVGDPAVPPVSAQRAASAAPASAGPSPLPQIEPSLPGPGPARTFSSAGGTVAVQCSGITPRLVYATPADGYALDERSVEGSELEVRFEAEETRVRLKVSCAGAAPALVEERVDD